MAGLDSNFTLSEAAPEDIEEQFTVLELAYETDEVAVIALADADPAAVHAWYMKYLAPRWLMPDITSYKITEVATGKIVAWTGLQFPWKYRPISDELKAMVTSHDLPPLVEGSNPEAIAKFFESLSFAEQYGYDMEHDYHRKGTMVHPDFQKRGFGSVLTRHCNAIMDKTGDRTFVPARPTSIKMFKDNGFKVVGFHDSHLERWGGPVEKSKTWLAIREAPSP